MLKGKLTVLGSTTFTPSTPNVLKVKCSASTLKVWVDGTLKITCTTDSDLAWGGVALSGWDALFDNLKVAYDTNADDAITSADDLVIDEDFSATTVSPTHDDAGNLTKDADYAYVFDAWNNLVKVKAQNDADVVVGQYAYYADNRRASKTVTRRGELDGTTYFFYDGLREIEERSGSEAVTQQYVWGHEYIDQLLMIRGSSGTWFAHQDANWNVIALTTPSGDVAEEYQYQPYGLPLVKRHLAFGDSDADGDVDSTDNTAHFAALTTYNRKFDADFDGDVGNNVGDPDRDAWDNSYNDPAASTTMVVANRSFSPTGNPFLFTGRRLDAETGLYYYRFRTYHPGLKQFIQRDPLGYGDSASLYQYVGGRPNAMQDPLGLMTQAGDDDVWRDWHHMVPKKHKGKVPKELNINDKSCGWEFKSYQDHNGRSTGASTVHSKWLREWDEFFVKYPKATARQIKAQMSKMIGDPAYAEWLGRGRPARANYRSRGKGKGVITIVGGFAVGMLVDELYGAAATLQDIMGSGYYGSLLAALDEGDWGRAYQLADLIEQHVLLGAKDRTAVDAYEWLMNLIEKAKAAWEIREQQHKELLERLAKERHP